MYLETLSSEKWLWRCTREKQLSSGTLHHLTVRKTNVIEIHASILKHGWRNRALPWAAERVTNEMLIDLPFILFLKCLPILEHSSCVGLPHCQQHWDSLHWAKSPIRSQLQYFLPCPIMTLLRDCLKVSRQGLTLAKFQALKWINLENLAWSS